MVPSLPEPSGGVRVGKMRFLNEALSLSVEANPHPLPPQQKGVGT